jgi:hypothetical protein
VDDLQRRLYEGERDAGWNPDNSLSEEVAHLHEEVSEIFRAHRLKQNEVTYDPETGKPQGVPIECADVAIGLFYIAEREGFDLLEVIEIKHRYNLTRSYVDEGRQLRG